MVNPNSRDWVVIAVFVGTNLTKSRQRAVCPKRPPDHGLGLRHTLSRAFSLVE
jgi:hypothetical protein